MCVYECSHPLDFCVSRVTYLELNVMNLYTIAYWSTEKKYKPPDLMI